MIKIPTAFNTKEIVINCQFLTLDKPKMDIPNSSGNGEAIIMAPIRGKIHVK